MISTHDLDLASVGVAWRAGESTLSGPARTFVESLDSTLAAWADEDRAESLSPGAWLAAETLARLDWFNAFPQLATFPVSLDSTKPNLDAFRDASPPDASGHIRLTKCDTPTTVLTPAACYHVWPQMEGARLETPHTLTLRTRCFRREAQVEPLRRQASFEMREIVRIGSGPETRAWISDRRERAVRLAVSLGLDVRVERATDPFFEPSRQPGYALQLAAPLKTELLAPGDLAIASFNLHQEHFGRAFDVHHNGRVAASACVAFGLERWLAAILEEHGPDARSWPEVPRG